MARSSSPCLEASKDAGKMIVMELAKGGELSEYLQKTGKMPEEKAKGTSAPARFDADHAETQ